MILFGNRHGERHSSTDRPTSAQIVSHSFGGILTQIWHLGYVFLQKQPGTKTSIFITQMRADGQWWTGSGRSTGEPLFPTGKVVLQLSIKANKQTDSDFYAIDIFIMTQPFCVLVLLGGPGGEPSAFKAVGKHAKTMTAVGRTDIVLLFPKTVPLGRKERRGTRPRYSGRRHCL